MKLDSKYFDCIRIKREEPRAAAPRHAPCQWEGCRDDGTHKAPMGRGREGQYFRFCLNHVREYNSNYNYFQGMSDDEVAAFQKDAVTGHRPTWKMAANSRGRDLGDEPARAYEERLKSRRADGRQSGFGSNADPHGFFGEDTAKPDASDRRRPLRKLEQKALESLDLTATATRQDIKARFKELVKRHHPDSNGGDKSSEEKLREIIQAYNYLKQAGLV
jgi:curved DNA-binding protein CbpA